MNNNRNNRRRGRGNRNSGGGNNQNRIDSRARGNAPQLLDKYKKLAQDAQHNGDRVQAEYYLQFADHYFRVIADNKARQEEARARRNEERAQANDDSEEDGGEGDNRRKNNRRSRGRRDDQDAPAPQEGEQGVEGDAVSEDEQVAKPKRRTRKPRREKAESGDDNSDSAGEIDSSVLPPAISASDKSDGDDNLEAVG